MGFVFLKPAIMAMVVTGLPCINETIVGCHWNRHAVTLNGCEMHDGVCFYEILVFNGCRQWTVRRRFREFLALHAALSSNATPIPAVPSTSFFRKRWSQRFLDRRYVQLEAWLRTMVEGDVHCQSELGTFLGVHPKPCETVQAGPLKAVSSSETLASVSTMAGSASLVTLAMLEDSDKEDEEGVAM